MKAIHCVRFKSIIFNESRLSNGEVVHFPAYNPRSGVTQKSWDESVGELMRENLTDDLNPGIVTGARALKKRVDLQVS